MSFSDVLNQKKAINILKKELKTAEISHAYLFLGEEGVGKKTVALEFAKSLNCKQEEADNCDDCINCRKITHGNHPDVKIVEIEEDSSELKIDQIREIQKEIAYKPYESERKLYIIDEADKMTVQAANSLLKTLEEPPSYATIILLAEEISSLLPTIISRCENVKLSNIPAEIIEKHLKEKGIEEKKAQISSIFSRGSPGRAFDFVNDEHTIENRKKLLDFLTSLPETSTVDIFNRIEEINEIVQSDFPFFNLISGWYRDIILCKKESENQVVNFDYKTEIKKQVSEYSLEQLTSIIGLINKYEGYIKRNCRSDLTLQVLFIKIRSKRV